MSKTIEEASKEFADREYEIGQVDWDALYKGYYHGMKDLFSQPLASRMTEEEKERVRKIYRDYRQKWDCSCNDIESERSFYCFSLLERIFGKELFEEE